MRVIQRHWVHVTQDTSPRDTSWGIVDNFTVFLNIFLKIIIMVDAKSCIPFIRAAASFLNWIFWCIPPCIEYFWTDP